MEVSEATALPHLYLGARRKHQIPYLAIPVDEDKKLLSMQQIGTGDESPDRRQVGVGSHAHRPFATTVVLGEDEGCRLVADDLLVEREDLEPESGVVEHRRQRLDRTVCRCSTGDDRVVDAEGGVELDLAAGGFRPGPRSEPKRPGGGREAVGEGRPRHGVPGGLGDLVPHRARQSAAETAVERICGERRSKCIHGSGLPDVKGGPR